MITRQLGANGPQVSAIGLGCMGMSDLYGPADETERIATIHAALAAGVTLLDTGDFYGMGHNELLIRQALQGHVREKMLRSVKFGALRGPDGQWLGIDGRPAAAKAFLAYTLRRLGTDYVDVYRPARLAEALGALDLTLSPADLARIEAAIPAGAAAGDRYQPQQMAHLDSERQGAHVG